MHTFLERLGELDHHSFLRLALHLLKPQPLYHQAWLDPVLECLYTHHLLEYNFTYFASFLTPACFSRFLKRIPSQVTEYTLHPVKEGAKKILTKTKSLPVFSHRGLIRYQFINIEK